MQSFMPDFIIGFFETIAAPIASWFVARDASNFALVQEMVTILLCQPTAWCL
jgi:hypothetical protein